MSDIDETAPLLQPLLDAGYCVFIHVILYFELFMQTELERRALSLRVRKVTHVSAVGRRSGRHSGALPLPLTFTLTRTPTGLLHPKSLHRVFPSWPRHSL
jgi:hypothetical protein